MNLRYSGKPIVTYAPPRKVIMNGRILDQPGWWEAWIEDERGACLAAGRSAHSAREATERLWEMAATLNPPILPYDPQWPMEGQEEAP